MTGPDASKRELVRGLGLFDATMIVVGSMIGSGIFLTSAESARLTGAPGWLLLAWALAGLLTITGAACCAEVAAMMPHAGGQYVFLREAYGRLVGFVYGWSMFLVIQTGTIAAVAVAFANFLGALVPGVSKEIYWIKPIEIGHYAISLSTQQAVAIGSIVFLTMVNGMGQWTGSLLQNVFTTAKTAALVGLIVAGLTMGWSADCAALSASWWDSAANGWNAAAAHPEADNLGAWTLPILFGLAMVGPMFSQTAWNGVTFTGGEVVEPERNLPRALIIGCTSVVVLYLLANVAYVGTLTWDGIQHAPSDRVGTAVMERLFGGAGTWIMAAAIVVSTFGCNNGLILAGSRIFYAMAHDGLFFKSMAHLNRFRVPAIALIAQGLWASILTMPRTVVVDPTSGAKTFGNVYTQLLEYIVGAELVFYLLLVISLFVFRYRRPNAIRPYRTFGYPLTPIIYLTLASVVLVDLVFVAPWTSGTGFLIVLTGIPVYLLWRR